VAQAISFGGGGARAYSVTAGILSALELSPDLLVAANSGAALAVARWLKSADDWTPHDLYEPHAAQHTLSTITRRQTLATVVAHLMCRLGRDTWRAIVSDLLHTGSPRREHAPDFIAVASRCSTPMCLEELSETDGWTLEQMCAHSSFVASPALFSLLGPTERLIPKHGSHYLVDGGFMDNLAVAPLIRRGFTEIVSVVNSPVPLSMDRSQWADNDVVNLFGWPNRIGGQACPVFDPADLDRTMEALVAGQGWATCAYAVGGRTVTVHWVYISPCDEFMESMPRRLAKRINAIDRFPHVPTFSPTLNVMTIAPFFANALFLYGKFLGRRLQSLLPPETVPAVAT